MNKKKLLISVIMLFLIIIFIVLFVLVKSNNKSKIDHFQNNKIESEVEKEIISQDETKDSENIINEDVKETIDYQEENNSVSDSSLSKNSVINNSQSNSNNANQEIKKEETTQEQVIQSCTEKKFVFSWARADFDIEQACINKGNSYQYRYGFSCDSYQDDCGVTYYTLTLFDTNGVEYDFHNID